MPDVERCFSDVYMDKEGGNTGTDELYHEYDLRGCKEKCLENDACLSLSYFTLNTVKFCTIYDRKIPEASLTDKDGAMHFERDCPSGIVS